MTTFRTAMAVAVIALMASAAPAVAENAHDWHQGGGAHGGDWHGHGGGGWHGGGDWHGGWHGGFGFYGPGVYPYGYGPYAYSDPYIAPPPVVAAPSWYCPPYNAYYPAVQSCPVPWQQVQ